MAYENYDFETVAAAAAATIPAGALTLDVAGFSSAGDGGKARYVQVSQRPFGVNILVNGDFADGAAWNVGAAAIVAGRLEFTSDTAAVTQDVAITAGAVYEVKFTVSNYVSGLARARIIGSMDANSATVSANGTHTFYLTAPVGASKFAVVGNSATFSVDDVSFRQAEPGSFQTADSKWWRLDGASQSVKAFGALGDGATNDTAAFQRALDWAKNRSGARLTIPSETYRIDGHLRADKFGGLLLEADASASSSPNGAILDFRANDGEPGLYVTNATGASGGVGFAVRGLVFRGVDAPNSPILKTNNTSGHSFIDTQFVGGEVGLWLYNGQTTRMFNCRVALATGRAGVLMNGQGDDGQSNGLEAFGCVFSADRNTFADCVRIDGSGGSAKFVGCGFLFGHHGVAFDNTTGGPTDPGYLYIIGGGFENCTGSPVLINKGKKILLSSFYCSSDGDYPGIDVGENVIDVTCSGLYIDGNGGDGVRAAGRNVVVSGCDIVKNGRKGRDAGYLRTVTNVTSGTGGRVRITYTETLGNGVNPFRKDDIAYVTGVAGVPGANGRYLVDVINATTIELRGSTFSGAYTSGGSLGREYSGVYVTPTGAAVVNGNRIGHRIGNAGAEGSNLQAYGVRLEGDRRCLVMANDCGDNGISETLNNNTNTRTFVFANGELNPLGA